jgi:chemotaxis protein CheD
MSAGAPIAVPTRSQRVYLEAYLHPGEVHGIAQPSRVTTILGSCVSVCLFERDGVLGGMNHFLLPSAPTVAAASTRYGDCAVDVLVKRLLALGATRERLIAKVFGGANVLHAFAEGSRHIGAANVEMARVALARHGIPIGAEDVGGTRGRKLVFSAPDGAAWVKVLGP